jgi:dipeptidyl aminopeptidase/acylaminoacyl peptidase
MTMNLSARVAGVGVGVVLVGSLVGCQPLQPRVWGVELVSMNASGTDSTRGGVEGLKPSPDGTKVAFSTWGSDLGPPDAGRDLDLYVRDLRSGATSLVSVNAAGTDGGNIDSGGVYTFSPDGSKIAFVTLASDLGPPDTPDTFDVYVRDLVHNTTTLVSEHPICGDGRADDPVFSPDGSRLAFDVGRGDSADLRDVYVRDLTTGTTTLASVHATPTGCDAIPSLLQTLPVAFGPDGTRLLINTPDSDLGPVDRNDAPDIYIRDLTAGTTSLVSAAAGTGEAANSETFGASFSPDGTKVLLLSRAQRLRPGRPERVPRCVPAGPDHGDHEPGIGQGRWHRQRRSVVERVGLQPGRHEGPLRQLLRRPPSTRHRHDEQSAERLPA